VFRFANVSLGSFGGSGPRVSSCPIFARGDMQGPERCFAMRTDHLRDGVWYGTTARIR
jgi:hypothetical protein